MLLDADKIKSAGRDTLTIDIPEWGGEIVIQELSLAELKEVSEAVGSETDATRLLLKYGIKNPVMTDDLLDFIVEELGAKGTGRITGAISSLQSRAEDESQEDREAAF